MRQAIFFLFIFLVLVNFVSAESGCCREDRTGNSCVYVEQSQCKVGSYFLGSVYCYVTTFCQSGCCYDPNTGVYDKGVLQGDCRKTWAADPHCNIPGAEGGCCILGNGKIFETRRQCEIDTNQSGIGDGVPQWEPISREECSALTLDTQGACVVDGGWCTHTDASVCSRQRGSFSPGELCTKPSLNTTCRITSTTRCVPGKDEVYFEDSCGNIANIYDASKSTNVYYWSYRVKKEDSCGVSDPGANANSQTCGNCESIGGSYCSAGGSPVLGNNYCAEKLCTTASGAVYRPGEGWCEYEGKIGNGSDVPGSKHWRYYCDKGIIKNDGCSDKRADICVQTSQFAPDGQHNISFAECKPNKAEDCPAYNTGTGGERLVNLATCAENPYCMVQRAEVDSNFKIDFCVPKFPVGYTFSQEASFEDAEERCGYATTTCVRKDWRNFWGNVYRINAACSNPIFTQRMNEICRKMGDCGGEVNLEGDYDQGFSVSGPSGHGVNSLETSWIESVLKPASVSDNDALYFFTGQEPLNITWVLNQEGQTWYYNRNFHGSEAFRAEANTECVEYGCCGEECSDSCCTLYETVSYTLYFNGGTSEVVNISTYNSLMERVQSGSFIYVNEGNSGNNPWYNTHVHRITFTCKPWMPPVGVDKCVLCNQENPLRPCTRNRCESLGRACTILNEGTGRELCAVNTTSPNAPVLDVLRNETFYRYADVAISGYKILDLTEDCFPAHTDLVLGVQTDVPSMCRYFVNDTGYVNMTNFENNWFSFNHTQSILLDNPSNGESGGPRVMANQQMFIKCQNMHGIENPTPYRIDYCVKEGPDTAFSGAISFEPPSQGYVNYNTSYALFSLYTRELSTCRTSVNDTGYENMETELSCETNIGAQSPRGYICSGNISTPSSVNVLYVKCKDQPWLENANRTSERNEKSVVYTVFKPDQKISINSIEPNSEIINNTDSVTVELKVMTSGGYGNHTCYWSKSPQSGSFNPMWITGVAGEHRQPGINRPVGDNTLYVYCVDGVFDRVGNFTTFRVTKDDIAPNIARVWRVGSTLHFITTETAECKYSMVRCAFGWVNASEAGTGLEHTIDVLRGKMYYLKCRDGFGNVPESCSLALRPV